MKRALPRLGIGEPRELRHGLLFCLRYFTGINEHRCAARNDRSLPRQLAGDNVAGPFDPGGEPGLAEQLYRFLRRFAGERRHGAVDVFFLRFAVLRLYAEIRQHFAEDAPDDGAAICPPEI